MEQGKLFDGKYRILKMLGKGGMSSVYLAENINLGTLWAIKEIRKSGASRIDILAEPNILKRLEHPALPRIFDIIEDENSICIVVDYIEGTSLDKKLEEAGKFPEDTVIGWAEKLCGVLAYLHEFRPNPIIYRDMKPSNIILAKDGSLKLIDFGTAREYKEGRDGDTVYIGTRGYAAPEQYGTGQTSVATDIYNLGATLHHLVTGKNPNGPPYVLKPARCYDKSISTEFERIICKCVRQNPEERYQSARELISDINGLREKRPAETEKSFGKSPDISGRKAIGAPSGFKRLILTVWDNAEFGCEMAYAAARLTGLSVLLIDIDLLSPKADIFLKVKKGSARVAEGNAVDGAGLDAVMDAAAKGRFDSDALIDACVRRREVKSLYILTGSDRLENYEYYSDKSLIKLIDKAYENFDVTVLLAGKYIYDSYSVISLMKSDRNIIPLRADIDRFREFNSYLLFLKEKQDIGLGKTKFVAYEYDERTNLSRREIEEVTEGNCIGFVSRSTIRARCRNSRAPYARRMEKKILNEYRDILGKLGIMPSRTVPEMLKEWLGMAVRGVGGNACDKHS